MWLQGPLGGRKLCQRGSEVAEELEVLFPGPSTFCGGDTLCLEEPGLGCLGCQAETQVWMPALLLLASWVITEESLTLSRLQFPCL